ncbi:MAG: citrate synthase [Candidatus Bathyarchaeota archaeon]|nr:citrate synthase [Candidatus Bathyarchaeota archaeon]
MEESQEEIKRGLKDVAACETRISHVDPKGQLYYAGYNTDVLVGRVSFAEAVYLTWFDNLPSQKELSDFESSIISEMNLPEAVIKRLKSYSNSNHPMDILQSEIPYLGMHDPDLGDNSDSANRKKAIRIVAKVPTIIANLNRIRNNEPLIPPDDKLDFASNFLYMFLGKYPDELERETINKYMYLHLDHGLAASTFVARSTVSTQSDIYSGITSALGSLKGKFHGGANERVRGMLNEIKNIEDIEAYIQGRLDVKKRIMGFGHRIYQADDPRTKHLRELCENLCRRANKLDLYEKSKEIEFVVLNKKNIRPNVDFYAATILDALGIPVTFSTAFFASGRVAGWIAHIIEELNQRIIMRPTSRYTGKYGREFISIDKR